MVTPKLLLTLAACLVAGVTAFGADAPRPATSAFLEKHCLECHDADTKKGDLDLASEMGRLGDNLRSMRPDLPWSGRQRMRGDEPLSLGDATEALADLADLDELSEALSQDYAGASLEDVDEEAVRRALGRGAADDLRELRRLERELEEQGYLNRAGDRLDLTAKAVRRLGQTALRHVFADLRSAGRGGHDVPDAGQAPVTAAPDTLPDTAAPIAPDTAAPAVAAPQRLTNAQRKALRKAKVA